MCVSRFSETHYLKALKYVYFCKDVRKHPSALFNLFIFSLTKPETSGWTRAELRSAGVFDTRLQGYMFYLTGYDWI